MVSSRRVLSLAALPVLALAAAKGNKTLSTKVLILGGGLTGVTAARTLALELNVTDYLVVEARHELGGRLQNTDIGGYNIEFGANWIQGLGTNPIWALAQKYNIKNQFSNWTSLDYFNDKGWESDGKIEKAIDRYEEEVFPEAQSTAGTRKELGLPDLSMKAGLSLTGWNALTPEEKLAEYFSHDWEYAEPPISSSFIVDIANYNDSFLDFGNGDNNLVIDPWGFKQIVVGQADEIPDLDQKLLLNQIVEKIEYNDDSVTVTTKAGYVITAEYAVTTFSLGVLQNDDVKFEPALPEWKKEGISQMHMATYTKIFARFETKFWNDTEFALYADPDERGYYAVWQSLDAPGFYPGSKVLFATLTSDLAYHAELQTDEETQAEFMSVLRAMYGPSIPDPVEFKFPRWTLDPLFRGTFTNFGAGVTEKQQDDLRAPVGGDTAATRRLFFAGEHTSRKYFGYLQGAYIEGRLVAHYLADCVFRNCSESETTGLVKRESEVRVRREDDQIQSRSPGQRRRMWR